MHEVAGQRGVSITVDVGSCFHPGAATAYLETMATRCISWNKQPFSLQPHPRLKKRIDDSVLVSVGIIGESVGAV